MILNCSFQSIVILHIVCDSIYGKRATERNWFVGKIELVDLSSPFVFRFFVFVSQRECIVKWIRMQLVDLVFLFRQFDWIRRM